MKSHTWSAIVLSGGTNKRFGSDKAAALLHGVTLLDHVLSFIPKEIKTIIVGKDVFEEPPLGGPVAGVARGLQEIDTEYRRSCSSRYALRIRTILAITIFN